MFLVDKYGTRSIFLEESGHVIWEVSHDVMILLSM